MLCPTDARKELSGMRITGAMDADGGTIELYKDNTSLTGCSTYRSYGDGVCDDVIIIPITKKQLLRNITISTNTVVTTCEVQIFAGNMIYMFLIGTYMFMYMYPQETLTIHNHYADKDLS